MNYAIERRDGVRYAGGYLRVERGGERRGHRGGGEGFGPPRRWVCIVSRFQVFLIIRLGLNQSCVLLICDLISFHWCCFSPRIVRIMPLRSAYRVRVYGLPPTASWQDLKDHMRKAGDVGYANVENGVSFW